MSIDSATLPDGIFAGRYRIVRKLGEGAMGAVYLAEHIRMGRLDAIKVLNPTLAVDRDSIARFERGARNVAAVRHPHVCTTYDFSETADGVQYLAMEYVEGPTLKAVMDEQGTLPVARAVEITRQAAEGLNAAHRAGIVHRDLKPANIMIDMRYGDGEVKVVDFDIAKGPEGGGDEVTRHGFVVGTPEYMSPEQLIGDKLDGRSDLYSLGIVLFRMLTGVQPFRAESTQDLMVERLTESPLRIDQVAPSLQIPPQLQQVLDRVLQRRSQDRQESAAVLAAELAQVAALLAGAPVAPEAWSPGAPAGAPPARGSASTRDAAEHPETRVASAAEHSAVAPASAARKWAPFMVGAVVVVIAGGAGAAWVLNRGPEPESVPGAVTGSGDAAPAAPPGVALASDSALVIDVLPATQQQPAAQQPVAQQSAGQQDAATVAPRQPASGPASAPAPQRQPLNAAAAGALLNRQLDVLLGEAAGSRTAARDSLEALWQDRSALAPVRQAAVAAALGEFYREGRDWQRCVTWYNRAVELNSSEFQARVRDECLERLRGGTP